MAFSGQSFPVLEYGNRVRNTRITAHLPGVIASNGTFEYRVMRAAYARYTFTIPAWKFTWSDRETLLAFWNQVGGKLLSFLWQDLDYNSFTNANIGTGTQLAAPNEPTTSPSTGSGLLALGTYSMTVTALNALGETTPSVANSTVLALTAPAPTLTPSTAAGTLVAATYEYAIVVHTATGYSVLGTTTSVTTTATGEISVSWASVTNATTYDVYGRVAGSLGLLISGVSGTSWTDTGANAVGAAPPTVATATGNIAVDWTAVNGATSYNVYRNNALVGNTTALTLTDTGNTPGGAAPAINGTGTTTYPLVVPVAGALHPIWHPNSNQTVESGGVGVSGWTVNIVNQQPAVVFPLGSCPLYGNAVTTSGGFSFAVRFNNDFIYTLLNAAQPQWGPSATDALEMIEVFE